MGQRTMPTSFSQLAIFESGLSQEISGAVVEAMPSFTSLVSLSLKRLVLIKK
jgi:hypothetical protein